MQRRDFTHALSCNGLYDASFNMKKTFILYFVVSTAEYVKIYLLISEFRMFLIVIPWNEYCLSYSTDCRLYRSLQDEL